MITFHVLYGIDFPANGGPDTAEDAAVTAKQHLVAVDAGIVILDTEDGPRKTIILTKQPDDVGYAVTIEATVTADSAYSAVQTLQQWASGGPRRVIVEWDSGAGNDVFTV